MIQGSISLQERAQCLERILLKIRGVISFVIDLDMRRCSIRICPKTTVKEVIEKIYSKTSMMALVVTKNKQKGIEVKAKTSKDYHLLTDNPLHSIFTYKQAMPRDSAGVFPVKIMYFSGSVVTRIVISQFHVSSRRKTAFLWSHGKNLW